MKSLTLFSVLLISIASFAQKIKVAESDERIGGGKNPAMVVSIYDVSVDDVGSEWKSLMKNKKAKVSMKDEVFADNAVISEINGNNTIDIYAKIEKVNDGETKLTVAFDLGGAFLSSSVDKEKFSQAKKMVHDFAIKTTKEGIAGKRKAAEKELSSLKSDQKELEKKHEKLTSSVDDYKQKIEDYKQKIKEAEDDKVKNKAEQEKKKADIVVQSKTVEAITAKEKAVE